MWTCQSLPRPYPTLRTRTTFFSSLFCLPFTLCQPLLTVSLKSLSKWFTITWAGLEFIPKSHLLRNENPGAISGRSNTKSTFWLGCLEPLHEGFLSLLSKEDHPLILVVDQLPTIVSDFPSQQKQKQKSKYKNRNKRSVFPFFQGRENGILPIGIHLVYSVNWVDLDSTNYHSKKSCLRLSGQMVLSYIRSLQASTPAWARSERPMSNWEGKLTSFTGQNQSILTLFFFVVIWCFANINSICNTSFPRLKQSVCFSSFSSTICGFSSLLAEFPGNWGSWEIA